MCPAIPCAPCASRGPGARAPWFRSLGLEPIYAMAAGVMAGGVLQLAVQVPALATPAAFAALLVRWSRSVPM